MTGDQQRRAKDLFLQALDQPEPERAAFVERDCPDDEAVRAEVMTLLAADRSLPPATPSAPAAASTHMPVIPGFRIIAELGEGATAVVYEAEQQRPRRMVALKLLRSGILSAERRRRFEHEIETLAGLNHPGIASLYEAVSVDGGRPGFAMELVKGRDLLTHARERCATDQQRLALFATVAEAVAYAHLRHVVHRDLKPHNILVTAEGQPKILDFGVARTTAGELSEATMHTTTGHILGTVAYMSPEQARGQSKSVDARSDVYALGVILFQLLTGKLPYPIEGKPPHVAMGIICETPPLPLGEVRPELKGDASTIVGKALEKDPLRRYQSVSDMVQDIGRLIERKPVVARPPSTAYRLWSFVDRRKLLMLGVLTPIAALGVATIGGTTVTLLALGVGLAALVFAGDRAVRIQSERQKVRAAMAEVERQRWDIFTAANLWFENLDRRALQRLGDDRSQPFDATRAIDHTILRPGLAAVERDYGTNPDISAALRNAAAIAFRELGMFAECEEQLRKVLLTREAQLPADHPDIAAAKANIGYLFIRADKPADAEPWLSDAVQSFRHASDDLWRLELAATSTLLGRVRMSLGNASGAVAALREAVVVRSRVQGEDHIDFARALDALSAGLLASGDSQAAVEASRRAVSILERQLPPGDLFLIRARLNLVRATRALRLHDEAAVQLTAVRAVAADLPAAGDLGQSLHRDFMELDSGEPG